MCLLMPMHSLASIFSLAYEISVVLLSVLCNHTALWISTVDFFIQLFSLSFWKQDILGNKLQKSVKWGYECYKINTYVGLQEKTKWRFCLHKDYTVTKMADQQFTKEKRQNFLYVIDPFFIWILNNIPMQFLP